MDVLRLERGVRKNRGMVEEEEEEEEEENI